MAIFLVLALSFVSSSALQVDFSDKEWKVKPVTKVVNLLKEMSGQIEKEAAEDAAMFDQMGCWCETNEREKTKAIEDAEQRITDLNAAIPEYAAKAAQLDVDIKHLTKEVAQNSETLNEATEIRAKEQDEFRSTEKDMIQSISSLKNAVGVMGKVNKGAALNQESIAQVQALLSKHMKQHADLVEHSMTGHQRSQVMSFLQTPQKTFLLQQKQAGNNKYDPASGPIFGILKGMKESFEQNLKQSQIDEEQGIKEFTELKAAKTREIASGEDLIDTKTVQLAEAKEKNAKSKEDLEDTRASLSADREFLSNMKLKCDNADKEYSDRQKVRNEEQKAVSETISILTDDDAKDQFNKSIKFIQLSSHTARRGRSSRDRAAEILKKAGSQLKSPKLVTLGMSMRLSGFDEVIAKMDTMVVALKQEQKDEVEQKDNCVAEFNENEMQTAKKMDFKGDLETKISTLESTIEELTEAIATLKAEIADTETEMKKASQIREEENHEFQTCINDQRATQAILKKAYDRMKAFYGFAQTSQEPPAQGTYKKNAGSSGILAMLETLMDESKATETEAAKGEADGQAGYESFMKDATATVDVKSKDIANKSEELAKSDAERVASQDDLKHTIEELLSLADYSSELHKSCDFLVKNFDLRQQSRVKEMEALNQAKAIFSGAKL